MPSNLGGVQMCMLAKLNVNKMHENNLQIERTNMHKPETKLVGGVNNPFEKY